MDEEHHDESVDPVCGMTVEPVSAAAHRTYEGREIYFCNVGCATKFDEDPARYVQLK